MKEIFLIMILFLNILYAGYEEGKRVFEKKCSSCHKGYIPADKIKKNFFEMDNRLLKLNAPTVNMLVYAIMEGPKHIGDKEDEEMRDAEIETYLKDYLENPDLDNTICDQHIIKFYSKKPSMKGKITDEEYADLASFFMNYKKNRLKKHPIKKIVLTKTFDTKDLLKKAKKEHKLIMIEAMSPECHYCKKMKREVIDLDDIQKLLNRDYIFVEVNVDEIKLPFGLEKEFKKFTPTFFVLNSEGKLLNSYPGAWIKSDFIEIMRENLKSK